MGRRINVGCGEFRMSGFENLDRTEVPPLPGREPIPLVKADALAFDYSGATEIYAGHFLEHLTMHDAQTFLRRALLQAEPGAVLAVTVPAMERAAGQDAATVHGMIHGGHRWPGDEHLSSWTRELLVIEMLSAGWTAVEEWAGCPWIAVQVSWQVCVRGLKKRDVDELGRP